MAFIVRYIKQERIDSAERWLQRKLTAEEIEERKDALRVETEDGASRLVNHLRSTGCIATFYHESEL